MVYVVLGRICFIINISFETNLFSNIYEIIIFPFHYNKHGRNIFMTKKRKFHIMINDDKTVLSSHKIFWFFDPNNEAQRSQCTWHDTQKKIFSGFNTKVYYETCCQFFVGVVSW